MNAITRKKTGSHRFALAAVLLLLGVACSRHQATTIHLTGSSTVAPIMEDLARRYEQQHPGIRIDVQTGGSSRGILDTRQRRNDIGMVSRALHDDERDLRATLIARDGLAIIVHTATPLTTITREIVRRIYLGQITNWRALDGPDLAIIVVHKAAGRATQELFLDWTGLRDEQARAQVIIGDNIQGIRTVAATPGAIGYVSIGSAQWEATHGTPIRILAVDGVAATPKMVADGRYPIIRELNLVTRREPAPPQVASFLAWVTSEATRDIFDSHLVVPVTAGRQ